jgi:hypothetical protein
VCLLGRAVFRRNIPSKGDSLRFNDPTAAAILALHALFNEGDDMGDEEESMHLLDSFLDGGGVSAAVRLLDEWPCPKILTYTANMMEVMLTICPSVRPDRCLEVLGRFCESGEWDYLGHMRDRG